jgi:hypothetical protein
LLAVASSYVATDTRFLNYCAQDGGPLLLICGILRLAVAISLVVSATCMHTYIHTMTYIHTHIIHTFIHDVMNPSL